MGTETPKSTGFRYCFDAVCIGSVLIYLVGRFYLRPRGIGGIWTASYLNDLLCLPIFVPFSLFLQRSMRLRKHDLAPTLFEILQHWAVFSIVFEVIVPRMPDQYQSTADVMDVVCYLVGGLLGWLIWGRVVSAREYPA